MSGTATITAVVLAGSRSGEADPVARAARVYAKCLAPVAGRPMLVHVLDSLLAVAEIREVLLVADPGLDLERSACLARAFASGRIGRRAPAASPAASIEAILEEEDRPLLVTTADHPLLSPAIVRGFLAAARGLEADLVAAVAPAEAVRAVAPGTRRTWWRFRDGRFSGANLFWLRGAAARPALAFWRRVERERKRPWRIVRMFGAGELLLHLSGALALAQAAARASRRLGCRIAVVPIAAGEAAIDVDTPADLALVEAILARRSSTGAAP
ncbi:MAG: NTP transferase domain-containing protein [Geminicoccaceae bacterium]|nr:NTP transferase domain-containing protein [Geminicoccaceae bacterium]